MSQIEWRSGGRGALLAAYVARVASLSCRSRSRAVVAARSPGPDRDRHASRVAAADPSFLDTRAYDNTLLTHHMPVENGHATDEAGAARQNE